MWPTYIWALGLASVFLRFLFAAPVTAELILTHTGSGRSHGPSLQQTPLRIDTMLGAGHAHSNTRDYTFQCNYGDFTNIFARLTGEKRWQNSVPRLSRTPQETFSNSTRNWQRNSLVRLTHFLQKVTRVENKPIAPQNTKIITHISSYLKTVTMNEKPRTHKRNRIHQYVFMMYLNRIVDNFFLNFIKIEKNLTMTINVCFRLYFYHITDLPQLRPFECIGSFMTY